MKITKRQLKNLVREVIEESKVSKRPFRLKEESNEDFDITPYITYNDYITEMLFNENFKRLDNDDTFIYTLGGKLSDELPTEDIEILKDKDGLATIVLQNRVSPEINAEDIVGLTSNELNEEYADKLEDWFDQYMLNDLERWELIEKTDDGYKFVDGVTGDKFIDAILEEEMLGYNIDENGLQEFIRNEIYEGDIDEIIEDYDTNYADTIAEIISRGYSQGDVATIYVNIPEYEKATGQKWSDELESTLSEEFSHYLWDTPIIARVDIDGEEYYDENFDGQYDYFDKDKFIEDILKQYKGPKDKADLKEALEDVIPEEPESMY